MKKVVMFLVLSILLLGCTTNETDAPQDIPDDGDVVDVPDTDDAGDSVDVLDNTTDDVTEGVEEDTGTASENTTDEDLTAEDDNETDSSDPEEDTTGRVNTVTIKGLKFDPQTLTVNVGDTVVWVNDESNTKHKLYDQSIGDIGEYEFRSETLYPGDTFNHTFNKAGEYPYRDAIFPDKMSGKIIVEE